jgi:hypothetical protein
MKRYAKPVCVVSLDHGTLMRSMFDGEYVLYADHEAEMQKLRTKLRGAYTDGWLKCREEYGRAYPQLNEHEDQLIAAIEPVIDALMERSKE